MLMAVDQHKLINAEFAEKEKSYTCPICAELVILKNGPKLIAHFAHQSTSKCFGSEGETQLHLQGKQALFCDLVTQYPKIALEVYLTDLKQRPDLLVDKLVFEYQCSPITNRRLKERVQGYQSHQIQSIWILGMDYFSKKLSSYTVLRFMRCQKNIGFYLLFLDATNHCYYLKYRITQLGNQYLCKQKRFDKYQKLIKFMETLHLVSYPKLNLITLTKLVEIKLRRHDPNMTNLQQLCYENGHLVNGCPIIAHYPQWMPPTLNVNWLSWKIKIILYIEKQQYCKIDDITNLTKYDEFLFIKTVNPVRLFLQVLQKYRYISIEQQNISLLRNFIWYRDTYDKIRAIKKMKKRSNYDSYKRSQP